MLQLPQQRTVFNIRFEFPFCRLTLSRSKQCRSSTKRNPPVCTLALAKRCSLPLPHLSSLRLVTSGLKALTNDALKGKKNNSSQRQPAAAEASSSQLCCAERNLLRAWVARATRAGVPRHQVVHWVRRKAGASITVWRHLADGSLGVSVPCVVCKATLAQFDLRVTCMVAPGQWYCGRLMDPGAPLAKPTSGQLMRRCKGSS
eukprot:GHRQ01013775.1.p1 GENE.GHRQ01013775.1~~GHRQ01013775.1.p1  ORF type:complete len:202 (+),score=18.53 GHRQ01013775.1:82-687(+)